jgi:heme a synthase
MTTPHSSRAIAVWLLICCVLLFAMIVLGGVTRLTRSGLSIVEWKPIAGAIPPLNEAQWQTEFEKYRQTPEYRQINRGMTLAGFKSIYWVEYAHRLLGRIIAIVVLVPLIYFWARRRIDKPLARKLSVAFGLGALQALVGWLMVASGLKDRPHVSAYWLVIHLTMALIIYSYVLWIALDLLRPTRDADDGNRTLRRYTLAFVAVLLVTIVAGGFVAGTRAGFVFNTFPLMNGEFIPAGAYATSPFWRDWFENVATVQFHHRLLAYATLLIGIALWWKTRGSITRRIQRAGTALLHALVLQVGLGIATVVTVVPVALGAAHQAGAILLLSVAVYMLHRPRTG